MACDGLPCFLHDVLFWRLAAMTLLTLTSAVPAPVSLAGQAITWDLVSAGGVSGGDQRQYDDGGGERRRDDIFVLSDCWIGVEFLVSAKAAAAVAFIVSSLVAVRVTVAALGPIAVLLVVARVTVAALGRVTVMSVATRVTVAALESAVVLSIFDE